MFVQKTNDSDGSCMLLVTLINYACGIGTLLVSGCPYKCVQWKVY